MQMLGQVAVPCAVAPARLLPSPACAAQIDYARGVDNTVAQFLAFQKALPSLDNRFGLTYGIGNSKFTLGVSAGMRGRGQAWHSAPH